MQVSWPTRFDQPVNRHSASPGVSVIVTLGLVTWTRVKVMSDTRVSVAATWPTCHQCIRVYGWHQSPSTRTGTRSRWSNWSQSNTGTNTNIRMWYSRSELQRRSSKVLERLCKDFLIVGWETVLIVHYTRPGSSIKQPTPNCFTTQRHVNWPVVYPKSSYKIMDPVSSSTPLQ